ncbi:tRNA (N(6)-L-threonylcarbamoyladenosine(37)-C(2))-methylthiotransferase MtaB [Chloroflexota bacterium]
MKIAFETLGCKLNQAESELLARQFSGAGYEVVTTGEPTDIYVLNTCTVTSTADAKSRQLLRQAQRNNPESIVIVTGCYAQRVPEEISGIEGVSLVAGNGDKTRLLSLIDDAGFFSPQSYYMKSIPAKGTAIFRTRSFVKIQDGCTSFCSYCIVPFVRGSEKSQSAELILSNIKKLVSEGINEVVLTGTEIGAYDYEGINLTALIERILSETTVPRLRLSSLQPQEISPQLVNLWQDERLCPHFHLSLQSGSDSVLKRMKRLYTTAGYSEAVAMIRKVLPEAAITTDIIAGFPGESEEEFEESLDFCRKTGFSRIHVFSYSPRPGTEAEKMTPRVPDSIKTQRNQKLRVLGKECITNYAGQFLNRSMDVLWEQQSNSIWSGYTANYIKIYARSARDLTNRIVPATLVKLYKGDGVWGEIEENV